MSDENECNMELTGNPLLMPGVGFAMWLSGKGVNIIGTPPADPITRAALLFQLVQTGKIDTNEIRMYIEEVGLMVPIAEN